MRNGRSNFAQAIERADDAQPDPLFYAIWHESNTAGTLGCTINDKFYRLIQPTPMYWADTQELQDAQQAAMLSSL